MLVHQIIHKVSTTALKWCLENSELKTLPVCENTQWLAGMSQSPQTEICVLSFSLLSLGQETREPPYLYRWRFAFQEESCPVSAQIWGDSTGPSLIQKARLSGSLGIVSDFRGSHSLHKLGTLLCAFINFIRYKHIWMSKHWNSALCKLLSNPCKAGFVIYIKLCIK